MKKTTCRGLNAAMGSRCDAYKDSDNESAGDSATVTGGTQPDSGVGSASPITAEVNETVVGEGFALTRITPEQVSNNIIKSVNFGSLADGFGIDAALVGQEINYFQILYDVPLGGVDFQTATVRDPSTKAQTLLVARVVASQFAANALWKEYSEPAHRVIFNKCQLETDRPFFGADVERSPSDQRTIKTGETRWNAQVDDLFWRILSRPPTTIERAAVRTAFITALESEGWPPSAWIPVLYALLSTEEFWHI